MDIANLLPQQRIVEIHHPANEDKLLGIRVELMSITDPKMKKIRRKIKDRQLLQQAKGKHFKADDIEENTNELIFSALISWSWYNPTQGTDDFDDEQHANFHGDRNPPFNQKTVYAVLTELEWFADQLSDEIANQQAFF